jgi:hypothetical protein
VVGEGRLGQQAVPEAVSPMAHACDDDQDAGPMPMVMLMMMLVVVCVCVCV